MAKKSTSNRHAVAWIAFLFGFILGVIATVLVINYLNPPKAPAKREALLQREVVAKQATASSSRPVKTAEPEVVVAVPVKPVAQQVQPPKKVEVISVLPSESVSRTEEGSTTPTAQASVVASDPIAALAQPQPKSPDPIAQLAKQQSSATAYKSSSLQVGAVSSQESVKALKAKMLLLGYEAHSKYVKTKKGNFYRVYIGPFKTKKELDAATDRLRAEGITYSIIN